MWERLTDTWQITQTGETNITLIDLFLCWTDGLLCFVFVSIQEIVQILRQRIATCFWQSQTDQTGHCDETT